MPAPVAQLVELSGFVGQFQARPTWCWAAVAASIHDFPPVRDSGAPYSQCAFVRAGLGVATGPCRVNRYQGACAANGCAATGYDVPGNLPGALSWAGIGCDPPRPYPHGDDVAGLAALHADIRDAIRIRKRPVVLNIEYAAPGGAVDHFLVVRGTDGDAAYLIWDPARGERRLTVPQILQESRWLFTIFIT